jgi:UDP-N-acetylmuramate dehydrogenase
MSWQNGFESIIQENVHLAPFTWFGLGGPARYFITPTSGDQLSAVIRRLHDAQIPVYILGNGANLLIRDQGVDGAVIQLSAPAFCAVKIDGRLVTVGAGADMMKLVRTTCKAGLAGIEPVAGIPGTLGGHIRMNAGGAFGEIGAAVATVTMLDAEGKMYKRSRDDLVFGYRHTNITGKVIVEAVLELQPENPEQLTQRMKEIWLYKKNSQPMGDKSAGCTFKNPDGQSAGKLIDMAGLKGAEMGGAMVSRRHANFIVAREGTRSSDVLSLIEHVQTMVESRFGVKLETEVVIW